jgi:hypothetical protein
MYIGIPRKETEKYNERQEKKCCCYGSDERQEQLPRKNNMQGQGSKRCCYTLNTPTKGHNRTWVFRKMDKNMTVRKLKPKCTMKEKELEQDGMTGDGN